MDRQASYLIIGSLFIISISC